MNSTITKEIESGLIEIGNQIKSWRDDETYRVVLDPKAFKTWADITANSLITCLLEKLDPGCIIISEEDAIFLHNRPKRYWLVDPIDGTASWFNGFDGFVTQLAYIENNIPVYGAVYAPCLKKLWTGLKGKGAYLNSEKLQKLRPITRLKLVDNYEKPNRVSQTIFDSGLVTEYIECGSLGLKSCLVADGTADLFVKDVVIRDWDIAPAEVILREVSGVIKNFDAENIKYSGEFEKNKGLIVARNNGILALSLNIIDNRRKDDK